MALVEDTELRNIKIYVEPCIKCGSEQIELYDCGYSSFNPGGGQCLKCGYKVTTYVDFAAPKRELASIWNKGNSKKKRLREIDLELKRLETERLQLLEEKEFIGE